MPRSASAEEAWSSAPSGDPLAGWRGARCRYTVQRALAARDSAPVPTIARQRPMRLTTTVFGPWPSRGVAGTDRAESACMPRNEFKHGRSPGRQGIEKERAQANALRDEHPKRGRVAEFHIVRQEGECRRVRWRTRRPWSSQWAWPVPLAPGCVNVAPPVPPPVTSTDGVLPPAPRLPPIRLWSIS